MHMHSFIHSVRQSIHHLFIHSFSPLFCRSIYKSVMEQNTINISKQYKHVAQMTKKRIRQMSIQHRQQQFMNVDLHVFSSQCATFEIMSTVLNQNLKLYNYTILSRNRCKYYSYGTQALAKYNQINLLHFIYIQTILY